MGRLRRRLLFPRFIRIGYMDMGGKGLNYEVCLFSDCFGHSLIQQLVGLWFRTPCSDYQIESCRFLLIVQIVTTPACVWVTQSAGRQTVSGFTQKIYHCSFVDHVSKVTYDSSVLGCRPVTVYAAVFCPTSIR